MTKIIWETVDGAERCRDENGNTCSVKYFSTREAALNALRSLIDCRDCTNCGNCRNCRNCSDCSSCSGCSGCSGCLACTDCSGCSGCLACTNCRNCRDCTDCKDCVNCSDCTDCKDCKDCYECSTCHNRFSLSLVTTLGKAYGTKTPKIIKNNFTFNGATYAIFWIALFCAFSLLTVALTFINGDLRLQLADEKERATFYSECLLSDKCKDLFK